MPSYTLHYFDARGHGEVSRMLFNLAGVEFTDHRVSRDNKEWSEMKPNTPFGCLPLLEVDGKFIPQSFAIARYLAKEFGFAGKTPFESSWVDALGDQYKDYTNEITPFFFAMTTPEKDKVQKEVAEPARDKFFAILEKKLKDNGSGYIVGPSVTWIDIVIADHVEALEKWIPGFFDTFPKVLVHRDTVYAIPQIKSWIEKRHPNPY